MRNMKINGLGKVLSTAIGVCMVVSGGTAVAAAAEENVSVLGEFASNLRMSAEDGDRQAMSDLSKFEQLSSDQRSELEAFLEGKRVPNLNYGEGETVATDGDFSRELKTSPSVTFYAAGGSKHIESWDEFKFAGISVTKTKVSGSYETKPGVGATRILGHQCTVVHNYQPLTQVKTDKSNAYTSGGNATFLCAVEVKRGWPSPWGRISWSTKNATQGVVGNGNGKVINQGWM
ncbi:hypothetical protein QP900_08820 [Corynebacterium marquesiae]|uniref:hypothetical protein n=2 Tax=Corynebacteriaceae TaxID=1653 RepID=UPI00254AC2BE|nr:hypothetical protein [Corynebacterium marquesiae]MDK8532199.1 hypothetical protein [Corynebacterium marquesiae]